MLNGKIAAVLAAASVFAFAGVYTAEAAVTHPLNAAEHAVRQKLKNGDPRLESEYPPLKNQYYPVDNKSFQEATITNPHAHTRKLVFKGDPLDVFAKLDMVTQIVLPSPPIAVNIGKAEAFTVEIIDALNSIFIKPTRQVELTNLIVNCENGAVYLFILKENPFQPWDMRCEVVDPHRQVRKDDAIGVIKSLYTNKRMPEMQYTTMDLRTPNSTAYIYDPLTKTGCMITLKRALALPRYGKSGYWVEFHNTAPAGAPKDAAVDVSSYSISEQSVWAKKLTKVAVPAASGDSASYLSPGDKLSMFMLLDDGKIPDFFQFRFALSGIRNIPVDVKLPTAHFGGVDDRKPSQTQIKAKKSVDERLREEYERLVREGKIEPMTQDEIDEDYERQVEARERAEQERERQEAARDNERIAAGQAQNQARPAIGFPAP